MKKFLIQNGIDALWISHAANRFYLTGFEGSAGLVIVTKNGQVNLLVDGRYTTAAKESKKENVKLLELTNKNIEKVLKGAQTIGIDPITMTVAELERVKTFVKDVKNVNLSKLRLNKTDDELKIIEKSCQILDKTFEYIIPFVKPGVSEKEIADQMFLKARSLGADKWSFDPIVASGPNSAIPHHRASTRKIAIGDFVKIDFGVVYKGYCSDMTRTIMVGKPKHPELIDVYFAVKEAQENALAAVKVGVTTGQLSQIAKDTLAKYGYDKYYTHGLGHGMGLEAHEFPYFSQVSDHKLEENQVFTIEPGVYLEGIGGVRIEDSVVIVNGKTKRLTKTSKDLIVLDYK